MAAYTYSEMITPNTHFQRAVNLALDLGKTDFIRSYIPTKSSIAVLQKYLKAALKPGNNRSSILIGPYGKGKSHTLFLALSLLSDYSDEAEGAVARLIDALEEINTQTAELIRTLRESKKRLLPVVINDRYLDIRQAFLASLKTALQQASLQDLMPNNYYQQCLLTIARWSDQFPDTYRSYLKYLQVNSLKQRDFENRLKQFDPDALNTFRECHKAILSGAAFDPLLESDVPTLYKQVAEALDEKTQYDGLFIVFDEFGKYLESAVTYKEAPRFGVLQDLAELCSRSTSPCMLMTCISHKAIGEYAGHLSDRQRNSFRTIEGRFSPIYFTSTFEGSFALIAGALGRERSKYAEFLQTHHDAFQQTVRECEALGCFSGYQTPVREIVKQCIPMHPLTTLALMKLSERAAQNERTLFTFLADSSSPLAEFMAKHDGRYALAPIGLVYEYFHVTIRENSYDEDLKDLVIYADSLMNTLPNDEARLIRAIVLFSMLSDSSLMAVRPVVKAALQWTDVRLEAAISSLEQAHRIYIRRSDGVLCLMRSATESIRQDIEREVSLRSSRIDIADQLGEIRDPGYTIPRRYNDRHEIVRFFQNVYISKDTFLRERTPAFLTRACTADGYVLSLLGDLTQEEVSQKLTQWNDARIVVLLPKTSFSFRSAIEECAAIKKLLGTSSDEVMTEELSYYFDDLLQVVNKGYADLFESGAQCITMNSVTSCRNVGYQVSRLCENELYPDTPLICHEMINRDSLSGQMRTARIRVIDAVLSSDDFIHSYELKTAEGAILRAVLGHLSEERMQSVLQLIRDYLKRCEGERIPACELYDILTRRPYGMRRGALPILIAYCLRGMKQSVTLYNHLQEMTLNGESLSAMDEHVDEYAFLIDRGSADQAQYLDLLRGWYTPQSEFPDLRAIHEALCRFVRALPRSARANRLQLGSAQEVYPVLPAIVDIRRELVRFDTNPRDMLISKLPKALGMQPGAMCAQKIKSALDRLASYTKELSFALKSLMYDRLGAMRTQSLHGAMTTWLQSLSPAQLNHTYDSTTTALLNVMRRDDNHTDAEWVNMIAVALTNLPIEDWSDQHVETIVTLLDKSLHAIEAVGPDEVRPDTMTSSGIQLQLEGRTIQQTLPDEELSGISSVVYDSVKSALDEFSDSLSPEEKLLVLAKLILHMNE